MIQKWSDQNHKLSVIVHENVAGQIYKDVFTEMKMSFFSICRRFNLKPDHFMLLTVYLLVYYIYSGQRSLTSYIILTEYFDVKKQIN